MAWTRPWVRFPLAPRRDVTRHRERPEPRWFRALVVLQPGARGGCGEKSLDAVVLSPAPSTVRGGCDEWPKTPDSRRGELVIDGSHVVIGALGTSLVVRGVWRVWQLKLLVRTRDG